MSKLVPYVFLQILLAVKYTLKKTPRTTPSSFFFFLVKLNCLTFCGLVDVWLESKDVIIAEKFSVENGITFPTTELKLNVGVV